jgi:hypothetical protein
MTSLILSDLSRCDELEHADALSVRGGSDCLKRGFPPSCHGGKPSGCEPPHYTPWPPLHFGSGSVYTPPGCYPQPGHIVPL